MVAQPHNIFSYSQIVNSFSEEKFESFRLIGSKAGLMTPIFGLNLRWMGISPAHPNDFHNYMNKGQNLILVPGGFEEATITEYGKINLLTHKKKGFIKYALRYGYTIYPMIIIGEEKAFKTFNHFLRLRLFLNKFKFPGVIPLNIFPFRNIDIVTVVGKGIDIPIINSPSIEEVNHYHKIYMDTMLTMFEKYKKKYNCDSKVILFNPKL